MARAALGWSVREAAQKAGIGHNTLNRFETGQDTYSSTVDAIRDAYEAAGILFLSAGEASLSGGIGVRLSSQERGE